MIEYIFSKNAYLLTFSDLDHLSDYCKLRGGVYFVESIPMTSTGKVQRRIVKENAIKLYELA